MIDRRTLLSAGAASLAVAAAPAWSTETEPKVFLDYTQAELDRAYDQRAWVPDIRRYVERYAANSDIVRARLGAPQTLAYGPTAPETLDLYRTDATRAPTMIYIHGGAWRAGRARSYGFLAETFVQAGANYIALDFGTVQDIGLDGMVTQIGRAIAWIHANADTLGADPDRLYVSGHSSGGHLAACALVADWPATHGAPDDILKGGTVISGMGDLKAVRLSARSSYVPFDDRIEHDYSPQRHLAKLNCSVIVGYGTLETPEFLRQSRELAAALERHGRLDALIVGAHYNHLDFVETLANPLSSLARAVLAQMRLI